MEAAGVFLLVVVGGDEIDGARVHGEASRVVAGMDLVHGFLGSLVVFEFEDVDVAAGELFKITSTLVAVMFRQSRSATQHWEQTGYCTRGRFILVLSGTIL